MTNSSRKFLLAGLLAAVPAVAAAQTTPPPAAPPPRPRPVIVTTPSPSEQWQRQVDRQQLQNQQNQGAVREQLRQGNLDRQRTNATDPALRNQLDAADRTDQQLYRARQNAATRRYQTAPQTDPNRPAPARASSTGH